MPGKKCIIPGCMSHLQMKKKVSLHRFPKDLDLKQKWIDAIKNEHWIVDVKLNSRICSNHFDNKQNIGNKVFINPNSIPKNYLNIIIEKDRNMQKMVEINQMSTNKLHMNELGMIRKRNEMSMKNIPLKSKNTLNMLIEEDSNMQENVEMNQPSTSQYHISPQDKITKQNEISLKNIPQKVLSSSSNGSSDSKTANNNLSPYRIKKQNKELLKLCKKTMQQNKYLKQKVSRKEKKIKLFQNKLNQLMKKISILSAKSSE